MNEKYGVVGLFSGDGKTSKSGTCLDYAVRYTESNGKLVELPATVGADGSIYLL